MNQPNDSATPRSRVFEIKKYPNRRFYDVTRSRHVTLNDLYELVQAGERILVTDSKTGTDITNVVLTQIILEHDPPKLDLFPASLLHEAIQANQQMVRKFVDTYFAQAVNSFAQSRQHFDEFLKKSGFSSMAPTAPFDWVRMLFPGMSPGNLTPGAVGTPEPSPPVSDDMESLREQVAALSTELARLQRRKAKPAKPSRPRRK
jgi:polyhydroxyalkanoate synthesis repressor PhaR